MFRKRRPEVVKNNDDERRQGWSLAAAIISALVAIALLAAGLSGSLGTPASFTLVGLAGAIGVIAALALISIALTNLGLSNKDEALGLPTGSVRAIIAISLIVFFVICTIYYFQNIANPTHILHGISKAQVGNITANQIIASYPDESGTYTVVLQMVPSQAATDFAKQIMTTLSTLVVAVSAFYFGTRTAAAKILMSGTTLVSISVKSDSSDPLKVGLERQFSATGTYADGSTADITSHVTWTSSDPQIATITSPGGLAKGEAAGSTKITASLAGVSGTADLQVTPLTSISVTSDSSKPLKVGSKRQFSATGTYADGSTADITSQVAWESSDTTVATITSPGGLAKGEATGSTKITASLAGVSGTADLQVK